MSDSDGGQDATSPQSVPLRPRTGRKHSRREGGSWRPRSGEKILKPVKNIETLQAGGLPKFLSAGR